MPNIEQNEARHNLKIQTQSLDQILVRTWKDPFFLILDEEKNIGLEIGFVCKKCTHLFTTSTKHILE